MVTTSLRSLRAIWSMKLSMTRIGPIVLTLAKDAGGKLAIVAMEVTDSKSVHAAAAQLKDIAIDLVAGGLRISACCEDTPTIVNILPYKLETEPATSTCNERDRHRLVPIHCWLAAFRLL
jgi:hypothetical protein